MVKVRNPFKSLGHLLAANASYSVNAAAIKKRSGFEIAGFIILLALLLLIANSFGSPKSQPTLHKSSQSAPATVDLQSNQTSNSSPAGPDVNAGSTQSNSVSTNVSSNSDASGNTSTSVTVNGTPISVPQNGTKHQDVGNAHVDISHSSTSNGTATNTYVSSTSTSVDSSSNSSNISVDTGGN